ncbi:MAG: transposase, partial [Rickettsiales bacterium]
AVDSDQPISQTARDLGINQKNMSNNKATCFEDNKRLKKELFLVKQERDLLKKAAAKLINLALRYS